MRAAWMRATPLLLLAACGAHAGRSDVAPTAASRSGPRPDIILIVADDLGVGDLGCYGADLIETPNMDGIAERGMRFTSAYSASSVCTPSRYALLTGRYPWRDGVDRPLMPAEPLVFAEGQPTIATSLRSAGYATACLGKWHLGYGRKDTPGALEIGPLDVGFDRYFGGRVRERGKPHFWISDREWVGWKDGRVVSLDEEGGGESAVMRPEVTLDALLAELAGFLRQAGDRPAFVYLATFHVHKPHLPAVRFRRASHAGAYGATVEELDWFVGRVLEELERAGRRDDALIVVTSDNGAPGLKAESMRGHRPNAALRGYKAQVWEGGSRIPFLVEWPGHVPAGATTDETLSLVDLPATFAAAVGSRLPGTMGVDSYDLLPVWRGDAVDSPVREATVTTSNMDISRAIRRGDWKLVLFRDGARELYDLAADPGETVDRAGDHADVVKELAGLLARYDAEGASRPDR